MRIVKQVRGTVGDKGTTPEIRHKPIRQTFFHNFVKKDERISIENESKSDGEEFDDDLLNRESLLFENFFNHRLRVRGVRFRFPSRKVESF